MMLHILYFFFLICNLLWDFCFLFFVLLIVPFFFLFLLPSHSERLLNLRAYFFRSGLICISMRFSGMENQHAFSKHKLLNKPNIVISHSIISQWILFLCLWLNIIQKYADIKYYYYFLLLLFVVHNHHWQIWNAFNVCIHIRNGYNAWNHFN